ncbi:hypothetical protein [Actinoalloteichus caeruleus]|uniref:hypothetical protein n=1 Tax=Actinoalloteichus cyanogriseus TaxID=2893586 RepID=UPI003AAB35CE
MAVLLREAPSLPYTDKVVETVDGLVPDGFQIPADDRTIVYRDPDQPLDESAAGIVRWSIHALPLKLHTLLPQAAEHAEHPADRVACEHGIRLTYELERCWEGRLSSFLNSSRDLSAPGRPCRESGKNTRHKRSKNTKKRA